MRNLAARFVAVTLIMLLIPFSVFAWNPLGHMVVATIAYQNLQPKARQQVDKITSYLQEQYPEMNSFIIAATWPDAIRSQRIETYSHWHYIDYSISTDGSPLKNLIDTDNAVYEMENIQLVTKNSHANPYERTRFLAFLAHITGDLHQPLHTVSNITANNPDGDKGGNLFFVRTAGARITLHKLWDDGAGEFDGESTPAHAKDLADVITAKYQKRDFNKKQINDLAPADWAKEGIENAKQSVYNTPEDQMPSSAYLANAKQLSERQAALAGYRLAQLLNEMLS